jgi:DNA-binding HxlR family transcriptional regulator
MQRTSFESLDCPIARSLECIGEWWSILILRDAFLGAARFDDFQRRLGIAPNMLARRLRALTDRGLFERRQYSDRPPRFEYALTERGRDFFPVLASLGTWGRRHVARDTTVSIADRRSGAPLDPVVVDRGTLAPITAETAGFVRAAAASARTRSPRRPRPVRKMRARRQGPRATGRGSG